MIITITYKVTGHPPWRGPYSKPYNNSMKAQARQCSKALPGHDEQVGPVRRFFDDRTKTVVGPRRLTKGETTFGVQRPPHGGGGFKGLTDWCWHYDDDPGFGIVKLDMDAARKVGADVWLDDYVKQVLQSCRWIVVKREIIKDDDTIPTPAPAPPSNQ